MRLLVENVTGMCSLVRVMSRLMNVVQTILIHILYNVLLVHCRVVWHDSVVEGQSPLQIGRNIDRMILDS